MCLPHSPTPLHGTGGKDAAPARERLADGGEPYEVPRFDTPTLRLPAFAKGWRMLANHADVGHHLGTLRLRTKQNIAFGKSFTCVLCFCQERSRAWLSAVKRALSCVQHAPQAEHESRSRSHFSERTLGMILKNSWSGNRPQSVSSRKRWIATCAMVSGDGGDVGVAVGSTDDAKLQPDRATGESGRDGEDCGLGASRGTKRATDLGEVISEMRLESMIAEHRAERGAADGFECAAGGAAGSEVGTVSPVADPGAIWRALWAFGRRT